MTELSAGADAFSSVSALERRGRDLGRTEYVNGIASLLCLFRSFVYSEIIFLHRLKMLQEKTNKTIAVGSNVFSKMFIFGGFMTGYELITLA